MLLIAIASIVMKIGSIVAGISSAVIDRNGKQNLVFSFYYCIFALEIVSITTLE